MSRYGRDLIIRGVKIVGACILLCVCLSTTVQIVLNKNFTPWLFIGSLESNQAQDFSSKDPPEFIVSICPHDPPEDTQMTCGTVLVPKNRTDMKNSSDKVSLAVVIFHSTNPEPKSDPILFLDGGPGGLTIDTLPLIFEDQIKPWLSDRAFIAFDQRGVGLSQPTLECSEVVDLNEAFINPKENYERYQERYLEELKKCRERLISEGIDLSGYSSAESAADVDAIRVALNFEQLNLYSISYGTRLAQVVMRDYPSGIRSVILDSAYPIEVNLFENFPRNLARSFDAFFDHCAVASVCAQEYPNLEQRFYSLVEELNSEPEEVEVGYEITGDDLVWMLSQALYSESVFIFMPDIIDDLENGEIEDAIALNDFLYFGNAFFNNHIYRTIQCREEISFSNLANVQDAIASNPNLEGYFDDYLFAFEECEVWAAGEINAKDREFLESDIPTLIFSGGFDPVTPPSWGSTLQQNLTNSTYVEIPQLAHGILYANQCTLQIGIEFIEEPQRPLDLECIENIPEPDFWPPD